MTTAFEPAKTRAAEAATRRVVLIGASNLTKCIGVVLGQARSCWGPRLEVLAALGHGRSYGRRTSVFGRQLPGVLESGLWRALADGPRLETAALVTDIGNDLLYEEPVSQIVDWVEECFDRLVAVHAQTVVTQLPLANLENLSQARFRLMRTLLFPRNRMSLAALAERAYALDDEVRRLAVERGFALVSQRGEWYGFDPLHIRFRRRSRAWRDILAAWREAAEESEPVGGARRVSSNFNLPQRLAHTWYLRSRVPHERRLWGIEQRGLQPAARLRDGTTVSIY